MQLRHHYFMQDQVKGLVPDLMKTDTCGTQRRNGTFTELLLFVVSVVLYLSALGLSN